MSVNLAGVDDSSFSDMLFGRDDEPSRPGLIAQAAGGTLFLDEIGELGHDAQLRLMRVIQEREYFPVGSELPRRADVRLVCSTNRDIRTMESGESFRPDLFFRLSRHHVRVPPLIDRLDDLPLLVDHFLEQAAQRLGVRVPTAPKALIPTLSVHHFPGNVRELESMCMDAVSQHDSYLMSMDAFKAVMDAHGLVATESAEFDDSIHYPTLLPTLKSAEQQLLAEALERVEGNQTAAARLLGISRQALNRRLKGRRSSESD